MNQETPIASPQEPIKEPVELFKAAMEFIKFVGGSQIAFKLLNAVESLESLVKTEKVKLEKKIPKRNYDEEEDEEEEDDY